MSINTNYMQIKQIFATAFFAVALAFMATPTVTLADHGDDYGWDMGSSGSSDYWSTPYYNDNASYSSDYWSTPYYNDNSSYSSDYWSTPYYNDNASYSSDYWSTPYYNDNASYSSDYYSTPYYNDNSSYTSGYSSTPSYSYGCSNCGDSSSYSTPSYGCSNCGSSTGYSSTPSYSYGCSNCGGSTGYTTSSGCGSSCGGSSASNYSIPSYTTGYSTYSPSNSHSNSTATSNPTNTSTNTNPNTNTNSNTNTTGPSTATSSSTSNSNATGGNSTSTATGGAGGNATTGPSTSNATTGPSTSTATGGNATGGNSNASTSVSSNNTNTITNNPTNTNNNSASTSVSVNLVNNSPSTATATNNATTTVNVVNNIVVNVPSSGYQGPYNPHTDNQNNLIVNCSINPSYNVQIGQDVSFYANATGGNGNYQYSWTGSDGLNSSSQSFTGRFYSAGSKYATVTVNSGGQSRSQTCNTNVGGSVTGSLNAYCTATPPTVNTNQYITWTAYPTGGNGNYSYSWSGSDGLSGSNSSLTQAYGSTGQKYANVTIYSNGQSVTANCAANVNAIYGYQTQASNVTLIKGTSDQVGQVSGIYLNQIPATGVSMSWKVGLFAIGLFIWSLFAAFVFSKKRKLALAGSVSTDSIADFKARMIAMKNR